MRAFSSIVAIVLVAVSLAGCYDVDDEYALEYEVEEEHGTAIFKALLTEPDFKEVADRVAPVTVRVSVVYPGEIAVDDHYYEYANGRVKAIRPADADFTLRTSRDLALSVINAREDGFRVFACALKEDAATLEAMNLLYAASFNGAKGRIVGSASDCTPVDGRQVSFRGLNSTLMDGTPLGLPRHVATMIRSTSGYTPDDVLAFNKWGGPVSWHEKSCVLLDTVNWTLVNWCAGAGYSSPSADRTACVDAVNEAYGKDDTTGWDAGLVAAEKAKKGTELALCKLAYGGL